jgi:serine/threonine protein kinase
MNHHPPDILIESSGDGEVDGENGGLAVNAAWSAVDEAAAYTELRASIAREVLRLSIQPGRLASAYDVGKPVGKGKFATVYKATRRADGEVVALKTLAIFDVMDARSREKCLREIKLVQSLDHPHVIKFLDSFVDGSQLVLVFELAAAGDLKRQLRKARDRHARFEEAVIWKYFSQIAAAVAHMHARRILHRDLKPANVMLTLAGVVKVGDLGLGRLLGTGTLAAHSTVGTPLYMAPEVLRGAGHDSAADVWSAGCILYELAMTISPFREPGLALTELFLKIQRAVIPPIADVYSIELRTLVADMLQYDPAKRPTMADVVVIAERMRDVTSKLKAQAKSFREKEVMAAGASGAGFDANSSTSNTSIVLATMTPISTSITPPLYPHKHMATSQNQRGTSARTLTCDTAMSSRTHTGADDGDVDGDRVYDVVPNIGTFDVSAAAPFVAASHLHDRLLWLGFFDVNGKSANPALLADARARASRDRFFFAHSSTLPELLAVIKWLAVVAVVATGNPKTNARALVRVAAIEAASRALCDAAASPLSVSTALILAVRDGELVEGYTAAASTLDTTTIMMSSANAVSLCNGHGSTAIELLSRLINSAEAAVSTPLVIPLIRVSDINHHDNIVEEASDSEAEEERGGDDDEGDGAEPDEEKRVTRILLPPPISLHLWAEEVTRGAPFVRINRGVGEEWRQRLHITSGELQNLREGQASCRDSFISLADHISSILSRIKAAEELLAASGSTGNSGNSDSAVHPLLPLVALARETESLRRAAVIRLETITVSLAHTTSSLDAIEEAVISVKEEADARVLDLSSGTRLTELRSAIATIRRDSNNLDLQIGLMRALQPKIDRRLYH